MVIDARYDWPAVMDEGMVVDITVAFREEVEYADTIPGSTRIKRTSPTIRLIVLDLAKIFMSLLVFRSRFINWQTDPDSVLQPSGKKNAPAGCKAEPEYKGKNRTETF
jgi:hypothetical protein